MKIFVLNGSPKGEKSNSLTLTKAFVEGMGRKAAAEVEVFSIYQKEIQPCRGCFGCWKATPGKCVIRDDMAEVLEKILEADVIIWSFPLYYFGMPSGAKAALDRQLPLLLPLMQKPEDDKSGCGSHPARYDLSGKRYVLISTCGFYTAKGNYEAVYAQFNRLWGKGNYETVFCGEGELFKIPQMQSLTEKYLEAVRQAGEEFAAGGISEKTKERLSRLLLPRDVFEEEANKSW